MDARASQRAQRRTQAAGLPVSGVVSVVVASHGRPLRLRWLLNALDEQTLAAAEWDVVVVHDYGEHTARRFIDSHPLAQLGRLRHLAIAPGTGSPSRQRNIGWRSTDRPLIAFCDDDCRPDPRWLECLVRAVDGRAVAFVQGATRPDPHESDVFAAPHFRSLHSEPPNRFAQTCNVLYPRDLIERLGGMDEDLITGEDVDLSTRARAAGAEHVPAPEALVYHAVEALTLPGAIRDNLKWRHLPAVVKRHPELRQACTLGFFWEPSHLFTTALAAGVLTSRKGALAMALGLPWVISEAGRRGWRPIDLIVNALELPGRAVRELALLLTFVAGSVRHRTLLL